MLKRPHVDEFLQRMGEMFECVLFTASLAKVRNLASLGRGRGGCGNSGKIMERELNYK